MANAVAYGFVGLEHLFSNRVADTNIQTIREAIDATIGEHNRQVNAIISTFVQRTTEYQIRYTEPGSGTLQPLDEWGNPIPVRQGAAYTLGFPLQGAGTAWGNNRVTRELMTVEEVNDHVLHALYRDADWMKRHILAALLDKSSWTFDDPEHGNLTIQPLANGDSTLFLRNNGTRSTDNHYIAQAAGIADATNPFPTIYDELREHPVNAGADIVAYVASNLVADIEGLATYFPVDDPEIRRGADSDVLVGRIGPGVGDELLGRADRVWIVEWNMLPDNYILAEARGRTGDIVMMREYPVAALQGLFPENHSPDGNVNEYRFIRYAGFGVKNRVGALAYFVSAGDTTYDVPTGYDAPLAV